MSLFFPKQPIFFDLFQDLNKSIQAVANLFQEFAEKGSQDAEEYAKRAKEIEKDADHKTHAIISKLNKTFITPFDREDIYLLAHEIDDIVDLIECVMMNIHIYHIIEEIPAVREFAPLMVEASHYMEKLIHALQGQKYTKELSDAKIMIHELEDKADIVFTKSISNLLRDETNAMKALKEKDILEGLEHVMDKFQSVSDIIEGIVVKSS